MLTTSPSSQPRTRRLAFHEAGHCVVAEALGLRVALLELLDAERDGIVRLARDNAHYSPVEQIAICEAGYIGGEVSGEPALTGEGEIDNLEAYAVAISVDEAEAKLLVASGRRVARSLLVVHRKRLHAIADALAERGRLTAADLAALAAI